MVRLHIVAILDCFCVMHHILLYHLLLYRHSMYIGSDWSLYSRRAMCGLLLCFYLTIPSKKQIPFSPGVASSSYDRCHGQYKSFSIFAHLDGSRTE